MLPSGVVGGEVGYDLGITQLYISDIKKGFKE